MCFSEYDSPVGRLLLTAENGFLTGVWMDRPAPEGAVPNENAEVLVKTRDWLDRYFRGEDPKPDIPLAPKGTEFQKKVWAILLGIGRGQTRTYGDIARELAGQAGGRMSAQAVGQAVGKNPISILIPCHRCVGAGGQLTGYAGGLDRKIWLLRHEGRQITKDKVLEQRSS